MRVCSFRALHPRPDLARDVSSPPWDTVTLEEARAMVRAQPLSFLRVVRAEADLPEGVDMHSETVYRHAAEALQELRSEGKLVRDTEAYFYVYRQRKGDHEQAGVVARCHVGEYEGGRVRRHERVLAGKVWDRARLIRALGAHPGLVFLMFRDRDDVAREIGEACRNEPLMDFEAEDGVQHTVWKVSGAGSMQAALSAIPCAYIADGHHRAAAAVEAAKRPGGRGAAAACPWFPVVLFPAGSLRVLGYHRGVRELNGHTPASFLAEVRQRFRVEPCERPGETAAGRVHLYLAGRWHAVHLAGAGMDVDDAAAGGDARCAGSAGPPSGARAGHRGSHAR
jgi:uncharacterized protein (DUF1015 family)